MPLDHLILSLMSQTSSRQCTSNRMGTLELLSVRLINFVSSLILWAGYEHRGIGKCSLFIFDPNHHGTTFKAKLEERKGWQMMLKRGGHTLKRSEYQIVQLLPGLMDERSQEYEDSKIMSSVTFP
jgi:hypothetical protein